MLRTANWIEWYRFQHERQSLLQGQAFEDYIERVLSLHHDDFDNPAPMGRFGDGGADGIAGAGSIVYACYGTRAQRDADNTTKRKIESDFSRALESWDGFSEWRFVTNASLGPNCVQYLNQLRQQYNEGSTRPITIATWRPDAIWDRALHNMSVERLDTLFPGVPGAANVELSDLIPLLDELGTNGHQPDQLESIRPVSVEKMDYNRLPAAYRLELGEWRSLAPDIDRWFRNNSDPGLRDQQGNNFKAVYERARSITSNPGELMERVYVSLGGADFRMDVVRANAVYAVTAYYFDSCHIFEEPPPDYAQGGDNVATH